MIRLILANTSTMVLAVSVGFFTLNGNKLDLAGLITSIMLIKDLQTALRSMPNVISILIDVHISITRLEEVLKFENFEDFKRNEDVLF